VAPLDKTRLISMSDRKDGKQRGGSGVRVARLEFCYLSVLIIAEKQPGLRLLKTLDCEKQKPLE
jgi:hypothetical protein